MQKPSPFQNSNYSYRHDNLHWHCYLWPSPIGRLLDYVILGYKYPLLSHFSSFAFLPSTGLIPRGETLFHFPLIIFLELNSCSENLLKQFKNLSLPSFFIASSKTMKDFFACKIVWAANHQNLGNIQRLFRLQKCLSRKLSISRKYLKTFPPAKLS